MDNEFTSNQVLRPNEAAYKRYCQRLKDDLGLDDEMVAIIVSLRNQVMVLQTRLHRLESTLEINEMGHSTRLTSYREVFQEGDWEDI